MNWLPTLAGWQWALLALVPLGIVLLYFLKLKRESLLVPSTLLWARTVEDLHVNSLIQWLRRNLLLLLQLLAVLLAALALLRPGMHATESSLAQKIFLIDCSASMQATDVTGADNRFQLAKQLIGQAIDGLGDQEQAMLIAFSDRADIVQSFTADRRRLRQALDQLRVSSRPTDISEALRAASGLVQANRPRTAGDDGGAAVETADMAAVETAAANTAAAVDAVVDAADAAGTAAAGMATTGTAMATAELLIYSDGKFPSASDFELTGLQPTFVSVGSEQPTNLSILAFSVERNPDRAGELQAFATIANTGTTAAGSPVSLKLDGGLIDAQQVSLEPGEETGVSFTLTSLDAQQLELTLDQEDDLLLDNVAHSGSAPLRLVSVMLITPGNRPLELALSTGQASSLGNVEVYPTAYLDQPAYAARAASGEVDLIIFDRCAPPQMPRCNTFFIGRLPPEGWQSGAAEQAPLLVDIDRTHPLMRYLEIYSILIAEAQLLQPPPAALPLLSSAGGPLLALAPRSGYQDLVMGFEILSDTPDGPSFNTDWQVHRSWPVFVFNVLRYLGGAAQGGALSTVSPGAVAPLRVGHGAAGGESIQVSGPGGGREEISLSAAAAASGTVPFSHTEEPGFYEVSNQAGQLLDRFVVNLFDLRESSLASAPHVSLGYETVESGPAVVEVRREFWRWLLVGVLAVTTLEWWVYARRLG